MRRLLIGAMILAIVATSVFTIPGGKSKAAGTFSRGVNLCGLEFGDPNVPGTYGINYISPTLSELDYFKSKGLTVIRLPFKWERVQRSLWGPLDPTDLGYLDTIVAGARARGMKVMPSTQNFGRYRLNGTEYVIGSPQVPRAAFSDFWKKMAAHYANEPAIYAYDLTNEPHDMGGYDWKTTAQEAVNAIRTVDQTHAIAVEGDQWSGAWTWASNNANLIISDPANNILYEAHQYFDANGSGVYSQGYDANGAYPNIGVDRLQPFLNWLHANGLKGFIGEFGVPDNDARWLTVIDNFLTKLDQEGMDAFYWAAGPWWGSYPLSIEPTKSNTPQMSILQKHLGGTIPPTTTPPPGTPTPPPATGTPPPTTAGYTISGSASPISVAPGSKENLAVSVTAAAAANVVVDLEVYNGAGTKVFQQYFSGQVFAAGETKQYTASYTPPSAGSYTLKAGVFANDWTVNYKWVDPVATFTASTSAQPTAPKGNKKLHLPVVTKTSAPSTPTSPASGPTFTQKASITPATQTVGGGVTLSLSVTSPTGGSATIDLEVYDGTGKQVFQKYFASQTFAAGETKPFTASYTPPSVGSYIFKAGEFSDDWAKLYNWSDPAATFSVVAQGSPAPQPTAAPAPPAPTAAPAPPLPAGKIIANPIVSRGKPAFASNGNGSMVVDGNYGDWNRWNAGSPSASSPAWVAVKVGSGPSKLLLNWSSSYSYNYNETTYGGPGNYLIQTSADSTNGSDGNWTTLANVSGNYVHGRAHSFDFSGKSWVRMYVTAKSSTTNSNGVAIDEIDIHDVSNGIQDSWFFMGDSITAGAFNRSSSHQPSFAAKTNQIAPAYFPAMINGGIGGETSASGVSHIDSWLQLNPDMKYWALGYGTNDAGGNTGDASGFKTNMQTIINKIKAAGRIPVIAKIPYSPDGNHNNVPVFNQAIDQLYAANGLTAGPDLYAWFSANSQEVSGDRLHPNDAGYASINRLWAEAMASLHQ